MEAAKYEAVPKDRREFIQKPIWQETHAGIQTSLRKPEPVREQTEVQSIAPAATPESKEDDFSWRQHRWSQGMRLHQSLLSARRPLR